MGKMLLVMLLSACVLGFNAPTVSAQAVTKAYAPEDLRELAVPDRIRVLEKEYAEQSRGRRMPDDQLEFYLDQIDESDWTFSRIKEDIAVSLGGGAVRPGGWNPGPGAGPGPGPAFIREEILCESRNERYVECRTPFRGQAMVARNLSSTRCIEGVNFGSRPGIVWVRSGCRARFVEDDRYVAPPVIGGEVICESRNNRPNECRTPFRGRAVLARQISGQYCIEGRTWGTRLGMVWVNGGCRGVFVEERGGIGGGVGYNVTCGSEDGRYRACAWNAREGRPVLIEQISDTACIEGRTWGYDRREGLWVDRGCRGRFGN